MMSSGAWHRVRGLATDLAIVLAGAVSLAGCVRLSGGEASPQAGTDPLETLSFRAGACFGACPAYAIEMRADGGAVLRRQRFTPATGATVVRLPAGAFRRIAAGFAPWRPAAGGRRSIGQTPETCQSIATDHSGYTIVWNAGTPRAATLDFYSGCHDPEYAGLQKAIHDLPADASITGLLGKEGE